MVVLEVASERRRSRAAVSPYRLHCIQSTKVLMVRESLVAVVDILAPEVAKWGAGTMNPASARGRMIARGF
jgi:hypothetical protein